MVYDIKVGDAVSQNRYNHEQESGNDLKTHGK